MAAVKGRYVELRAADRHSFLGWCVEPSGPPRGGLVVLQEIFGVNGHIRRVTEQFAGHGYLAVAPLLFDRVRPNLEFGYDQVEAGRDVMLGLARAQTILDITAAAEAVQRAGRVGAIGYCWGGALADLAACACPVDAGVSYYGRHTVTWLELQPKCPVQYHFGALDPLIPPDVVAQIRAGRPAGEFFLYPDAGHGFNCDERHEFHAPSAALALERTRAFLTKHIDHRNS